MLKPLQTFRLWVHIFTITLKFFRNKFCLSLPHLNTQLKRTIDHDFSLLYDHKPSHILVKRISCTSLALQTWQVRTPQMRTRTRKKCIQNSRPRWHFFQLKFLKYHLNSFPDPQSLQTKTTHFLNFTSIFATTTQKAFSVSTYLTPPPAHLYHTSSTINPHDQGLGTINVDQFISVKIPCMYCSTKKRSSYPSISKYRQHLRQHHSHLEYKDDAGKLRWRCEMPDDSKGICNHTSKCMISMVCVSMPRNSPVTRVKKK